MTKQSYRPGSEGATQAKSEKKWFLAYSIAVSVIFLLFVLPVGTYFHHYYKHAAGFLAFIGWLIFIGLHGFVWYYYPRYKDIKRWLSPGWAFAVCFGGLGLMCLFLGGFNFSLFGL